MSRIFDKSFKYVPSFGTDLKKKFKRIREQQKKAAAEREQKVTPLKARKS